MFSFSIEESLSACQRVIESETSRECDTWDRFAQGYLAAKRPLLDALCPETGRRVYPTETAPTDAERGRALRAALCGGAGTEAYEAVTTASCRRATAAPEFVESSAAALTRAERHRDLLHRFEGPLQTFTCYTNAASLATGALDSETAAALANLYPGAQPAQKITRALGAYLRHAGASNDEASQVVDAVTRAQANRCRPKAGAVVLSVNPLDILLMTEHCTYSSCQNLQGCHRAGTLAYLQDNCTAVLYYYEEVKPFRGLDLPKKLIRQVVYFDGARYSALIQRRYGNGLTDPLALLARRAVAHALTRLQDPSLPAEVEALAWLHRKPSDSLPAVGNPAGIAYVDPTEDIVKLERGNDALPQIRLTPRVPCPGCGDRLSVPSEFLCEDCREDPSPRCCDCDGEADEDYAHDGDVYCEGCFHERFTRCDHCHNYTDSDDVSCTNDHYYCRSCWEDLFTVCDRCNEDVHNDDTHNIERTDGSEDGPFCESCYDHLTVECDVCSERFHTDDVNDDSLCETCADERRNEDLCLRLVCSPLYRSLAPRPRRFALALRWRAAVCPALPVRTLYRLLSATESSTQEVVNV